MRNTKQNGDEMKAQIEKDITKIGVIAVILAIGAVVISIAGVIMSFMLIMGKV